MNARELNSRGRPQEEGVVTRKHRNYQRWSGWELEERNILASLPLLSNPLLMSLINEKMTGSGQQGHPRREAIHKGHSCGAQYQV